MFIIPLGKIAPLESKILTNFLLLFKIVFQKKIVFEGMACWLPYVRHYNPLLNTNHI